MLDTLFFRLGFLITNLLIVEGLFGKNAVKCGHSAGLCNFLKTLYLRLIDVDNDCAVYFVELVQVTYSAFDQLNQDQCFHNCITSGSNCELVVIRFWVEDAERVAKVAAYLTAYRYSDFIFSGLLFLLLNFVISLHI